MGNLGDLSPQGSVAVGIIVGLLSTSIQSLGLTLQRKSHILEDENGPHDVRRPPHRRRRWQLGMGMFIISNLVGSTIQITTLPLPVLSTLQASGLVFNSICATLILGEPFTRWSLGGTLLVSSGAVLIAIFGAIPEPAHNLDQLLDLLGRRPFVIWMICQALLVAGIVILAGFLTRIKASQSPRIRLLTGLAYGCASAILSAHSLLDAKSAVELLIRTIVDGKNQFDRWQSWIILLGLVALALTQLYYLHRGLKLVSTSVLYPLVFCVYNIIAILDGLIYFEQTSLLSTLHAWLIALGTAILLSGVLALSWRLSDEQTQPAVAQSALAPGMGIVEDTDIEDSLDSYNADEESVAEAENQALLSGEPMTPTTKLNTVLGATRGIRKSVRLAEAEEIWSELQDDDAEASPLLLGRAHTVEAVGSWNASFNQGPRNADENSPLLQQPHAPSRRRRRRSTGFHGFTARPLPRSPRKRNASSPWSLGGILSMPWWNRDGDGPPTSTPRFPGGNIAPNSGIP